VGELPEDGQQLWPKHVGAIINKKKYIVQQVGYKYWTHGYNME
jgi:hypothetical protein